MAMSTDEKTLIALASPAMLDSVGEFSICEDTQVLAQYNINDKIVGFGIAPTAEEARRKAAEAVLDKLERTRPDLVDLIKESRSAKYHAMHRLGQAHRQRALLSGKMVYKSRDALCKISDAYASSDEENDDEPSPKPKLKRKMKSQGSQPSRSRRGFRYLMSTRS